MDFPFDSFFLREFFMAKKGMTYAGAGVDYGPMDRFKIAAQERARKTMNNIRRLGIREISSSRGESAYLLRLVVSKLTMLIFGHVQEGLGTKALIADTMYRLTGKLYYKNIAQCTVAMIVNDLITLGLLPVDVAMNLSVGDSAWFNDAKRYLDLVNGWGDACDLSGCTYGPGETPTLKGVVYPDAIELSGSAIGIIRKMKYQIDSKKIKAGDAIMFAGSSGIHANGLTLARLIAERKDSIFRRIAHFFFRGLVPLRALPDGYLTRLPNGRTYGETLLDPTHIYVRFIEECQKAGVDIHYAVNITGHGWRKLMRAVQPFMYVIERLPKQLAIFNFIQKYGPMDDREAYGNLNMGVGFAIYVSENDVQKVLKIGKKFKFPVFKAGHIEKGEKMVVIKPKNLVYRGETLAVR